MPNAILQFFEYKHLPPKLQEVSAPFGELAAQTDLVGVVYTLKQILCVKG